MKTSSYLRLLVAVGLSAAVLVASEQHGTVTFAGFPVPGVAVTATQGDKKVTSITDGMGSYSFPDLADGTWNVQVDMSGFSPIKQDVAVAAGAPASNFELKIKSLSEIQAAVQPVLAEPRPATAAAAAANTARPVPPSAAKPKPQAQVQAQAAAAGGRGGAPAAGADAPAPAAPADDASQRAADGFLVNGSQVNGGASPFALNPAFGNNRRGPRSLYTYMLSFNLDNSALDARTFSQTGQDTPKPATNVFTLNASVQGPLRIPHLFRNGPTFFVNFFITRSRRASNQSVLVPTDDQKSGNLSGFAGQIFDPSTLLPFAGNQIPANRISQQASALLALYPKPNFLGSSAFNYQVALVNVSHAEGFNVRMNRQLGRKNSIQGTFALQSSNGSTPNLFNFLDTNSGLGINIDPQWRHQFTPRFSTTLEVQVTRNAQHTYSFFENRTNFSGANGILGNNQASTYWGPPSLGFSSIAGLNDGVPSFIRPTTELVKADAAWNHGRHSVTFGIDTRKQQFNSLSQSNPRGNFTFNGQATGSGLAAPGSDLADFLLGIPDAVTLATGNADKYLRATGYDAYIADDWRVNSALTLNANVRYEFNGTVSELYGRLANLDIGPGFASVAEVTGNNPVGALSKQGYPNSLIRAEKFPFGPGIGLAWRPISGSSLVVRAGYSLRFSNPNYQTLAGNLDQQGPTSTNLSVPNPIGGKAAPGCPTALPFSLCLANGFVGTSQSTAETFAIDPNFKEAYAQNWQLTLQKDLPAGMQMQAGYSGIKGTRMPQFFYPNSYAGTVDPCPTCPKEFRYEESNGNSTRHAGTLQLRRRLHNGFQASMTYTYAKAIDDQGGTAQNWRNLSAERGLSSFDQRHNVQVQLQYTSGMGLGGGSLISGWKAVALKEWTIVVPITWGTGLPETPTFPGLLGGTSASVLRPDFTGEPIYAAAPGLFLNKNAFALPAAGQFGNASVGSITGPQQFQLRATAQRTFRVNDRITLNLQINAQNALNHVVFGQYVAAFNTPTFGVATGANGMRTVTTVAQFRF